jgi:FO synthase
MTWQDALAKAADGLGLSEAEASSLIGCDDTGAMVPIAARLRDQGHGRSVSYSRKVFIPLTQLCRDVCHYCTFAQRPHGLKRPYMLPDEVLEVARAGAAAGCKEALFTLGDKPELRYSAARKGLADLGHATTLDYLAAMAERVFAETGLLPHINAGVLQQSEIERLRAVSISQGTMLESAADRLCEKGQPHYGSPDKVPAVRLHTIDAAGRARVPFTSGLLIGIGETRAERIDALLALRRLNEAYGHLQEIIIQPFRAKPGTRMADHPDAPLDELIWTLVIARLVFGPQMSIQTPPNLSPGVLPRLVEAGINDWGGVSPVTCDHVNPEAPWPHLDRLADETAEAGKTLVERLALYPPFTRHLERWVDARFKSAILRHIDASGFVRDDEWQAGIVTPLPKPAVPATGASDDLDTILRAASDAQTLTESQIVRLFAARGPEVARVAGAADAVRIRVNGDAVAYVVNRNINYTNICYFHCGFCAFSKGKTHQALRGKPYNLGMEEIARRVREAWARGATEVCLQGGIHPDYTGETYLEICRTVKDVAPGIHVHAFSPLEVTQGAATLGISLEAFLLRLKEAGLGSLPGTAAEILDDEVRAVICPDKLDTNQWLRVLETAHGVGLKTTSTIMFGHVEAPLHWARHLLHLRALQTRTGGITEFVPLPFVHKEAPIALKGNARKGPTFREALLMHAVGRLALHPLITNIQGSWVKLGPQGVARVLDAGANDLGGTLMNESITRAAGASHGQELGPERMDALIRASGRTPRQRTTTYGDPDRGQVAKSYAAAPLADVVNELTTRKWARLAAE